MSEPDNPRAFPISTIGRFTQEGMTLRDWFAGQAIGAIIRQCASDCALGYPKGIESIEQLFAENAYKMADAMLTTREGPSQ